MRIARPVISLLAKDWQQKLLHHNALEHGHHTITLFDPWQYQEFMHAEDLPDPLQTWHIAPL